MEQEMECSICMQLLLDPVVASCGHDFCRACLWSWADALPGNKPVACPLCRCELAPCADVVKTFGVCVRLKHMLESMYPDKVAQRRRERQLQEDARLSKSQRSAAQQLLHFRQGRARYLRARRTRGHSAAPNPPSAASTAAGLPTGSSNSSAAGTSAAAGHLAGGSRGATATMAGARQVRLLTENAAAPAPSASMAVGAAVLPWAPHGSAHASMLLPMAAPGAPGVDGGAWQAPSTVTFTMGWWEAPGKKGERRRRQQQRLALLQQGRARGSAVLAGAQRGVMPAAVPVAH